MDARSFDASIEAFFAMLLSELSHPRPMEIEHATTQQQQQQQQQQQHGPGKAAAHRNDRLVRPVLPGAGLTLPGRPHGVLRQQARGSRHPPRSPEPVLGGARV
ncbi:hypothetical protein METBIDRAFT_12068 [Metschnikowia bicuspidata var. bicuspidata NRRL YB-4993]|uniref:Uncharacterized protein n=1 Tax=Metschnikowia bicuspidata var. bicuspidata NRRL YB-4993 TaxID=869754 RepID=A0A1A0HBR1_9ASCO|nr:hypothetical protein METBIDRAFT_12068 [Metschnikowia bicuspidata var. bicuspidata NRRL YB-4993]OBA21574.1 hypothetical protein METBIDRAFT_12068 [Metschnikowia bicuspidata var. bicuspidata NRRL YB-4993]